MQGVPSAAAAAATTSFPPPGLVFPLPRSSPGSPGSPRLVLLRERNQGALEKLTPEKHTLAVPELSPCPWGPPLFLAHPKALHASEKHVHHRAMQGCSSAPHSPLSWCKSTQLPASTYYHTGCPIGQGSIRDVGMTCYPSNVSCAPVDILRLIIKHIFKGGGSIKHVSTHCMQHTLQEEGTQLSGLAPPRALTLPGQVEHHWSTE